MLIAALLLLAAAAPDWGTVTIRQDAGRVAVSLENSKIRVRYGRTDFGDMKEKQITEFFVKATGRNIAGKQFDEMGFSAHEGRGFITRASLLESTKDSKTVRIEWEKGKSVQDVTMYRDSAVLKMDYIAYGINLVDIPFDKDFQGAFIAHGADKWKRGFVEYPKIFYDRYPKDVGEENIAEIDDPGPLDYHGWFILGAYDQRNGHGYGRVISSRHVNIIKWLDRRGMELFTNYGEERTPFTGWIFPVTGGEREILSLGRRIADGLLEPPRSTGPARPYNPPVFRRVVVDGRTGCCYQDVKIPADLDGDGFVDIATGRYPFDFGAPAPFTIYRYPDWKSSVIATGHWTTDGQAADVDNDGDLDLITGDEMRKQAVWFENPRPSGDPFQTQWKMHAIGTLERHFVHDVEVADVNKDGKIDVLTRLKGYKTLLWTQKTPDSWQRTELKTAPDSQGSNFADIDRDGDLDIVVENVWLENPHPISNGNWTAHAYTAGWPDDIAVTAADFNKDGRLDIAVAAAEAEGQFVWYEAPANAKDPNWTKHVVSPKVSFIHTFKVGDVDLDGWPDIVYGEMHQSSSKRIGYFLNRKQGEEWEPHVVSRSGVHNIRIADFGKDGDIDIFGANWGGENPLELYENQLRDPGRLAKMLPADRWTYIEADSKRAKWGDFEEPAWLKYLGLAAKDVNRDNRRDIVSGKYLYLNPGGDLASPWKRIEFPINLDASVLMHLEKDGQMDALAQHLDTVYWLRPGDPQASSFIPVRIGKLPKGEHGNGQGHGFDQVESGELEEPVFSTSHGLFYFRVPREKPKDNQLPRVRITANASEEGFAFADIDGDTYVDAVASNTDGNRIFWWKNPGDGSPDWKGFPVGETREWSDRIGAADLNSDGRYDVVVAEETRMKDASVYWYEQPADLANGKWVRHTLVTQYTTNAMDVADINNDGHPDIVTGEHRGTRKLSVWVNDGAGNFREQPVSMGYENHLGARVFDLDGDGDLDIVGIAWDSYPKLHIWRNDAIRRDAK